MSFKKCDLAAIVLTAIILALLIAPVTASAASATGYEFHSKWGSRGSGDTQFYNPFYITVSDTTGYLYVTDTWNHRVMKFTTDGSYVTRWGSKGSGNGQFEYPSGIAVNNSGYVYVTDAGNERIQVFDSDGTFVRKWGEFGSGLGSDGKFNDPSGIAVSSSGYVYVSDSLNNRIQKFTPSGKYVTQWGNLGSGAGNFNETYGIAVDQTSGNVYVADGKNHRVQVFDSDGTYVTSWGSEGTGNGQFKSPYGIAIHPTTGNVYVTDRANNNIQKFNSTGSYVTGSRAGEYGTGNVQFYVPRGVAVGSYVYIVDCMNDRIMTYRWVGLPVPTPTSSGGGGESSTAAAASSDIKAGESVVLNLDKGDSALTDVVITVNEDVSAILVTAELVTLPRSVEAPENDIYQYIDVEPYKVSESSIEQATFGFYVPQSWLTQNGYGTGDIAMLRYHDSAWQQLPTEFVKEQHGRVYYRAVSPGLSYFAIAYELGGTVTAEETSIVPVPTTAVPTTAATAVATTAVLTTAATTVATTAVPTAATPAPGFTAIGVIAGLGAAVFIVLRRR